MPGGGHAPRCAARGAAGRPVGGRRQRGQWDRTWSEQRGGCPSLYAKAAGSLHPNTAIAVCPCQGAGFDTPRTVVPRAKGAEGGERVEKGCKGMFRLPTPWLPLLLALVPGAVEFDRAVAEQAAKHFQLAGISHQIRQWVCHSSDAIAKIPLEIPSPDFVFIDHAKPPYKEDVSAIVARGDGREILLVADNVEDRKQELEDFLEWIPSIALNLTVISTECGLLVARVKVGN